MSFKNWGINALCLQHLLASSVGLCLWSWPTSLSRSPNLPPALTSAERGATVPLLGSLLTSVKMPPWGTGCKGREGWGAPHKDPPLGVTFSVVRSWRLRQRPQNGLSLLCVTLKGPALRDCGRPALPPPQGPPGLSRGKISLSYYPSLSHYPSLS